MQQLDMMIGGFDAMDMMMNLNREEDVAILFVHGGVREMKNQNHMDMTYQQIEVLPTILTGQKGDVKNALQKKKKKKKKNEKLPNSSKKKKKKSKISNVKYNNNELDKVLVTAIRDGGCKTSSVVKDAISKGANVNTTIDNCLVLCCSGIADKYLSSDDFCLKAQWKT